MELSTVEVEEEIAKLRGGKQQGFTLNDVYIV